MSQATAFMKAVGMPDDMVSKHLERDYVLTYTVDGNKMKCYVKVVNDASLGEKSYNVEMGKEQEYESLDKEKLKLLVNFEGGKFVERYNDLVRGGIYEVTREISGDVMTVTTKMGEHTMQQKWVKC